LTQDFGIPEMKATYVIDEMVGDKTVTWVPAGQSIRLVPSELLRVISEEMRNAWREERDEERGSFLCTRERMIELMGPDFNMNNLDMREIETAIMGDKYIKR
jgi:hypothetical protein